ncbi:MAG: hypothetical protein M3R36_07495 [Bacteroidota bacterium]|nr:hypothetical protein [Bacteroidota bacterium]
MNNLHNKTFPNESREYRDTPKQSFKIFDIKGSEITSLIDSGLQKGIYKIMFDASSLSSGTYFYSLYSNENLIDTKNH